MSGLSAQQLEALAILREHPALTPEDLAVLLGTSMQGASRTASSLVRRGLVRRLRERGRVAYESIDQPRRPPS